MNSKNYGGLACKNRKGKLWKFIDDNATFEIPYPEFISALYFPLFNEEGMMSSITPELRGDIKTSKYNFLLEPTTREGLSETKYSRNFWIFCENNVWSITGVSANASLKKVINPTFEKSNLTCGFGWHKISRYNKDLKLKSNITTYIPSNRDKIEISLIEIENKDNRSKEIDFTVAIPIFGRSVDNIRDHRHVTSLLNRFIEDKDGIILKPTMKFDERGHLTNNMNYFVFSFYDGQKKPDYIFKSLNNFVGEGNGLDMPEAVFRDIKPNENCEGAIGGIKFKKLKIKSKERVKFVTILGICRQINEIKSYKDKYNNYKKSEDELSKTKKYWLEKTSQIRFRSGDNNFDRWMRWVTFQPLVRKVYGCSFLPDFDYGYGGRGWRDIWQDCLALLLKYPKETHKLIINNFSGVRIDGTNATIVGKKMGEFIADRNNITRVWMDHGMWPTLTLSQYIEQTGDLDILFEEQTYFRDKFILRCQKIDPNWKESQENILKTDSNKIYYGNILEHLLVQNLTSFFNVGDHNIIRLENADWNDGLDMAKERGESVAFSCMYYNNLNLIIKYLQLIDKKEVELFKDIYTLLDTINNPIDYNSISEKRKILNKYLDDILDNFRGEKIKIKISDLIEDLKRKANNLKSIIKNQEWIETDKGSFFNGYYNNDQNQVEGEINGSIRMTLTGQVFSILSNIASKDQINLILSSIKKNLKDPEFGGIRLNTNFGEIQLNLGRAFAFSYGDKENGAFFSHMIVMLIYALYKRGYVDEGYEIFKSVYDMANNTQKSKIYPGIPEYFNSEGRGLYHYLTGSASWLVYTMVDQIFGISSSLGDLKVEPKLKKIQFKKSDKIELEINFANHRYLIRYLNSSKLDYKNYSISTIKLNEKIIHNKKSKKVVIKRKDLLDNSISNKNILKIILK